MTIIEKKSERKKKAIMKLVETGEYSIAYAMMLAEQLNDEGKLLDSDYEELAEYLESLLEPEDVIEEEQESEPVLSLSVEEPTEEINETATEVVESEEE